MGRHSAPDDPEPDPQGDGPESAATLDLGRRYGRHAHGEDGPAPDDQHTQRIAVVDASLLDVRHDTDTGELAAVDAPAAPWAVPGPQQDSDELPDLATELGLPAASAPTDAPETPETLETPETPEKQKKQKKQKPPREPRAAKAPKQPKTPKTPKQPKQAGSGSESNTRADLRLLRTNSAVRAQAIGAVVVSFLLYTLVMLVLGRTSSFATWVWVPIVLSGILVGAVLDLAHRRRD